MFGQRFRLKTAAIAVTDGPEKRIAIELPEGAQFVVLDQVPYDAPLHNQQVNVKWDGKVVSIFLVDIREKGEWIPPESKGRSVSDR